ncbi:MAG TPA: hypothetical protein VHG28_07040 [Longimicrobiaceae bacterium]|nr:hypothetical protein [Longimicrobiaceae bacterium]
MEPVTAVHDPELTARVVSRAPLLYAAGADPALDRPAHVRAGSGVSWVAGCLAVVQDDASFVALVDPATREVRAVTLPAGEDGKRQFDALRGTKGLKLDLECCVTVPEGGGELLLAWGSGSTARRERVALLEGWTEGRPEVTVVDASALYARLRARTEFSGSELNVEGAVFVDGCVRLFGRGNGAPRNGVLPMDATCDLEWEALRAYLRDPAHAPPPEPRSVVRYRLGALDGLPLTFTDATAAGGRVVFSAAAEDSPDATRDGRVAGSALGVIDAPGRARWTVLRDAEGWSFPDKVEGVALSPGSAGRAYAVVDRDDPAVPSELLEVELAGPWGVAGG